MRFLRLVTALALLGCSMPAALGQAFVVAACGAAALPLGSTGQPLQITATGMICVASDPVTTQAVGGNVAAGTTDSGNPVKVGGIYLTTPPTLTNGQRGDVQLDVNSNLRSRIVTSITAATDGHSNSVIGSATRSDTSSSSQTLLAVAQWNFNGATWDRQFSCPLSAAVNVTAGATTELVALTASQTIRVCSFAITMSAAGTAQFVTGTGTNCGTGTANLTGAMTLGTTTPMAISAGGNSLLRSAVAGALCLAAVTGNVTGFVNYAKY